MSSERPIGEILKSKPTPTEFLGLTVLWEIIK